MSGPKVGRPSNYSTEIAQKICDLVAERVPVIEICAMDGMPSKNTLYRWKRENKEFSDLYARAREERADARSDHIDEVVKKLLDGEIDANVARVIIDAEKWQMAKEKPRIYGDKITNEISGSLAVTEAIDRPPNETRDEWIARRKRELGQGAALGTAAGSANGRNHS